MRRCYIQGLRRDSKLAGRVRLRFVIGADGAVSNVGKPWPRVVAARAEVTKPDRPDLEDETTVTCILGVVEELSFPRPAGGIVVVSHTYELSLR